MLALNRKNVLLLLFFTISCPFLLHFEVTHVYAYQHLENLIVSDDEVLVIDNTEYFQYGDVTVEENGNLTIINSKFCMAGENVTRINILDNGTLKVINSELTSQVHVLNFRCYSNSRIQFEDTMFSFWGSTLIELWGNSTAFIKNSRQEEWVQLETHDAATVTVKNSMIAMIQLSGSSTVFFQDSNITSGSSCAQNSTLISKHSYFQEWLYVEDSAKFIASEDSAIGMLWPTGSSNIKINNSSVNGLEPKGSSKILITNSSSINFFTINIPPGFSRISDLREGYIENYTLYEERTGLSINIYKSSMENFILNVGSTSHLFLEDSSIDQLSVSRYGSATIYNSEVKIAYCDEYSWITLWNSKTSFPVQSQKTAIVRYFSTVNADLFYTTLVIAIILAVALAITISILWFMKKS